MGGELGAKWHALVLAALAGLSLLVWYPVLSIGPLGDDFWLIGGLCDEAGAVRPGAIVDVALARDEAWLGPGRFLRPVWRASYAVDALLVGRWEGAIQALNLALHVTCSFLLCALVLALTRARGPAVLAGALFAVFPAFPEAVAWGAGRTDLLATAPLLAMAVVVARGGPRWLAAVLLLLALGGKESAVIGAPLVTVLERTRGPWRAALRRSLWSFGLVAGWLLLRWAVLGELVGGHAHQGAQPVWNPSTWAMRAAQVPAVAFPFTSLPAGGAMGWLAWMAASVLLAAVALRALRRGGPALHGLLVGLALLLLALVPLHELVIPTARWPLPGSRHAYLLSAGWCAALAAALHVMTGPAASVSARTGWAVLVLVATLGAGLETRSRARDCAQAGDAMRRLRTALSSEPVGAGPLVAHGPIDWLGWLHVGSGAFPSALHPPFGPGSMRGVHVTTARELEASGVGAGLLALLAHPRVEVREIDLQRGLLPGAGLPLRAVVRGRLVDAGGYALEHARAPFDPGGLDLAPHVGASVEVRADSWVVDRADVGLPLTRDLVAAEVVPWEPLLVVEDGRIVLRGAPGGEVALLVGSTPGLFPLGSDGALRLASPLDWFLFRADANGEYVVDPRALGLPADAPRRTLLVQPARLDDDRVTLGGLHAVTL